MRGLSGLPADAVAGLDGIADRKFANTRYNYHELLDCCRGLTEKLIIRAGGRVTEEAYIIPVQKPIPPPLEQWESPGMQQ